MPKGPESFKYTPEEQVEIERERDETLKREEGMTLKREKIKTEEGETYWIEKSSYLPKKRLPDEKKRLAMAMDVLHEKALWLNNAEEYLDKIDEFDEPKDLWGNTFFVREAIKLNVHNLANIVGTSYANDRKIILEAIKIGGGEALQYASDELRENKEVVLEAVKQKGSALDYAHSKLQNDKEVVLAAVKNDGTALLYASKRLKEDEEVVLAAAEQNEEALKNTTNTILAKIEKEAQEKHDEVLLKKIAKAKEYLLIKQQEWMEFEARQKATREWLRRMEDVFERGRWISHD